MSGSRKSSGLRRADRTDRRHDRRPFRRRRRGPLRLVAHDAEDLKVIATLVQDAVLPMTEMRSTPGAAASRFC